MWGRACFRPAERLRSPVAFRQAFKKGVRLDGPLFTLIAAPGGGRTDRLGIVAGRKLGGAVARNRARRLLREAFRAHKRAVAPRLDLVLIPKQALLVASAAEVMHEYRERLRRLAGRRLGAGARPVVPD